MSEWRRWLLWLVGALAAVMIAAGAFALVNVWDRTRLSALTGIEISAMAVFVLPWCFVFGRRARASYSPDDPGYLAWETLSRGSAFLLLGQLCAFLPSAIALDRASPWILAFGQILPAGFRVALCWALWRIRKSYLGTGLDFHLLAIDKIIAVCLAASSLVLISRREVLLAYWTANNEVSRTAGYVLIATQLVNYLLYPALFFLGLTLYRYSAQMKGGRVAGAWGGVALYGLLQPLHAFLVAVLYPIYGPAYSVAIDNFIVLAAFSALAIGPIYQVEAAELCRPPKLGGPAGNSPAPA